MTDTKDRPNTEERYSNATHATNLVVVAEKGGAGDVLIAAGMSKSRLGAALMRLASEWDGAEKPKPLSAVAINLLAQERARTGGRQKPSQQDHREVSAQAAEWLLHEQKILMGKLKTLRDVREPLRLRAEDGNMGHPLEKAMAALMWWLDSMCHACHGRKWETIADTPVLSDRACPVCRASGERRKPHGFETMALLGYIDDCVYAARDSMTRKLRQFPHHTDERRGVAAVAKTRSAA